MMEYLGQQWKKTNDVKDYIKKKGGSKRNMNLNPSLFRQENDPSLSSRKVINQMENQKKVKQIFYDLQVNEIQAINIKKLMEDLNEKHKKCEQLYDEIYKKKKVIEKNKGNGRNGQQRDQSSEQQKLRKKNMSKFNMNEEYHRKINKMDEKQKKISEQISLFRHNGLNRLESLLLTNQKTEEKENNCLNEEQNICKKMTELDKILSKFMLEDIEHAFSMYGESSRLKKQKSYEQERQGNNLENSRLQQILNANRVTKNTTNIYSAQQFIEISRITLQKEGYSQRNSDKQANGIKK